MDAESEALVREAGDALGLLYVILHRRVDGTLHETVVVGRAEALIAYRNVKSEYVVFITQARNFTGVSFKHYGPSLARYIDPPSAQDYLRMLGLRSLLDKSTDTAEERLANVFGVKPSCVSARARPSERVGRNKNLLTMYDGDRPDGLPGRVYRGLGGDDPFDEEPEDEDYDPEEFDDGGTV